MLKALLTDVDGTITDSTRRIDTGAIEIIRSLVDDGIEVVLASGNTACFMDALCKMAGTKGTFIAENGGVYRIGYTGALIITGDQGVCRTSLEAVQAHYRKKGIELDLYNPTYRYADLAFARTVPVEEVRQVLAGQPVQVIDTGYAIHLQSEGVSKGTAIVALARDMGLSPRDFFAIGDGANDAQMLEWAGRGVTIANAHPATKAAASDVMDEGYGKGFVQAVKKYRSYLRAR
ncbi:phosphoglycolate phosphatase [Methanoregula sp.]|uniref:phosphoglycolate phosphatase n=1 Tax=Methanoregula sp. TaxID=2052170 RepID=UPI003BB0C9D9